MNAIEVDELHDLARKVLHLANTNRFSFITEAVWSLIPDLVLLDENNDYEFTTRHRYRHHNSGVAYFTDVTVILPAQGNWEEYSFEVFEQQVPGVEHLKMDLVGVKKVERL
jgi:hypothetical protein